MLDPNYCDILSALSDAKAEYLLIGAYAMAAHSTPRYTGDIDIWLNPTPDNARKVWKALVAFDAPLAGWKVEDLRSPSLFFQIGRRPCRIDFLCSIEGVTFEEAWPRRIIWEVDDLKIPVIGRADLLKNKRATGRPKDLLDVKLLEDNASKRKRRSTKKKK